MICRFCSQPLSYEFVNLNFSPPSNSYLSTDQLSYQESYYPLKVMVCKHCFLVQIDEYKKSSEIFNANYPYFSSMSSSWVEHARTYVEMICQKQPFSAESLIIEIASNDGYLLQFFKAKNIPCIGIEPTKSTADTAKSKGIDVVEDFFGVTLAQTLPKADLILGNNVLAHVPDINDFVMGLKMVLKTDGIITMEFPHLLNLIEHNQFDTIYHEHYSYLSLMTTITIFKAHGLAIYDVEELPTHGGSLRIYAMHDTDHPPMTDRLENVLLKERKTHLHTLQGYSGFQFKVDKVKNDFLAFLSESNSKGKKIIAYGAAAKGNTLLNYCEIKNDRIDFVVDKAPSKIGKFLPGSHIPVVSEEKIREVKPDYIIIFPWNIKEEIIMQLTYVREWDAKFVVAIPSLEIL